MLNFKQLDGGYVYCVPKIWRFPLTLIIAHTMVLCTTVTTLWLWSYLCLVSTIPLPFCHCCCTR